MKVTPFAASLAESIDLYFAAVARWNAHNPQQLKIRGWDFQKLLDASLQRTQSIRSSL